ncbi:hypothetical protein FM112_05775 [Gulosibacter sp. 10]|nr:hypothetical protein FM112_05775 [Gulosibacter sp. 10]
MSSLRADGVLGGLRKKIWHTSCRMHQVRLTLSIEGRLL